MSLSAFLAQNAERIDNVKYVASERFKDENGNPMEWEIRAITAKQNKEIQNQCMKYTVVPGKRAQQRRELDLIEYQTKLAVACTVFPDLNNAELQNSYGVMGADVLLDTMLTPGELTDYVVEVQGICGFESMDKLVEDAKN